MNRIVLPLLLTACVAEEPDTSTIDSDITVWQWTDDAMISNQDSAKQVGLASFGDLLMVHNGSSSPHDLYWTEFNGSSWTSNQKIPNQYAEGGPALVVFANRPTMVYRAWGENHLLLSTLDTFTWSAASVAGTALPANTTINAAPSATVHNGQLYVATCRSTSGVSKVHIDRFDGSTWRSAGGLDTGLPCRHVALASFEGVMHLIWTLEDFSGNWYMAEAVIQTSGGVTTWQQNPNLPMKSKKPPSMVVCNNEVHLVHGGFSNANEIWWSYRLNGAWVDDVKVVNQASNAGAALGCYANRTPIMVHNGDTTNHLWWSEFVTP